MEEENFQLAIKDIKKNQNLEKNHCSSTGMLFGTLNSDGYFYLKKDPKTLNN